MGIIDIGIVKIINEDGFWICIFPWEILYSKEIIEITPSPKQTIVLRLKWRFYGSRRMHTFDYIMKSAETANKVYNDIII